MAINILSLTRNKRNIFIFEKLLTCLELTKKISFPRSKTSYLSMIKKHGMGINTNETLPTFRPTYKKSAEIAEIRFNLYINK